MSEEIKSEDKFLDLECLIKEYSDLVKRHVDCLPPYATFKTYLIDEENCCKDDKDNACINRPEKIKNLVNALSSDVEDDKLNAILELWASNKKSTVLNDNFKQDYPQLIHSITPRANTIATQLELKNTKDYDEQKIKILAFAGDIKNLVNDSNHEKLNKDKFEELGSAKKELLFWYYYRKDIYPIVNQRAMKSKNILASCFKENHKTDIEFNKICMEIKGFEAIEEDNSIYISKQLMLDQLFYSIDEMKSMKKVDDIYKNKDDIYKFYKKLWNTIKEAKTNPGLQDYYNEYCRDYLKIEKEWHKNFEKWSSILQMLKAETFKNYEELNDAFKKKCKDGKDDFLKRYLFEKGANGITGGGQYHRGWEEIVEKIDKSEELKNSVLAILKTEDIEVAEQLIEKLIGESHKLKRNRFLIPLFPENMTAVSSTDSLKKLIGNLKSKLNITIDGESYLDQNNALMDIYLKNDNGNEANTYNKQLFYWWLHTILNDNLDLKKAIVYYGAPGTGKTYKAKKVAKQFMHTWGIKNGSNYSEDKKSYDLQQFHPSFSYEDFIEGIRPTQGQELELRDGVFKKFCKEKGEIEINLWKDQEFKTKFHDINDFSKIQVSIILEMSNDIQNILGINIANDKMSEEDTEKLKAENKKKYKDLTLSDIIPPAFFIIDEINRADLSRVFGELMYSLEYRGYEGKIKTQYSYLVEKADDKAVFFFEGGSNYFFIPQNIYIIGTMNTIDRSVDSFDFALRRRFSWEEIAPDYEVIKEKLSSKIAVSIAKSLEAVNTEITKNPLLGSDYQIGHSYALNLENQEQMNPKNAKDFLWKNFIEPLLQEYFRGLGDSKSNIDTLKDKFY